MKRNILFFIIIFIIIIGLIFFFQFRKSTLTINIVPKDATIKINDKIYLVDENGILKVKLTPNSYKISVSKEGYKTYNQTISLKARDEIELNIVLEVEKNINDPIKETVISYLQSLGISESQYSQYKIEIKLGEKGYAEAHIIKPEEDTEPALFIILEKNNNVWQIVEVGDITVERYEKLLPKKDLIPKLPYITDSFEIRYFPNYDEFFVTIKKEPVEKVKEEVRTWFDQQGVDRDIITIRWALSPVLTREQK